MAKLEYERAAGILVEKSAVDRDAFKIGRQIRDSLLSFPDRLAEVLAAEVDVQKIQAFLTREVNQVLLALQTDPGEPPAGTTHHASSTHVG